LKKSDIMCEIIPAWAEMRELTENACLMRKAWNLARLIMLLCFKTRAPQRQRCGWKMTGMGTRC